ACERAFATAGGKLEPCAPAGAGARSVTRTGRNNRSSTLVRNKGIFFIPLRCRTSSPAAIFSRSPKRILRLLRSLRNERIEHIRSTLHEQVDFLVGYDIGRHEIDCGAERSQQ